MTPARVERNELPAKRFAWILAAITCVGLLWRYFYISTEAPVRAVSDEGWYITQSQRLFTSHPFTAFNNFNVPTADHGPLLPVILGPVSWLVPSATTSLRLLMPIFGAAIIVLLALFVRSIAGGRAGLIAAGIAAVYPDLWVRDGLVSAEPLAMLLLIAILWIAYTMLNGVSIKRTLFAGLLCGLVGLSRSELLAAALLTLGVALWLGARSASRPLGATLLLLCSMVVVTMVTISPWIAYNQGRFEAQVLFTNNVGSTVAGANCEKAYYGPLTGFDSPYCRNMAAREALARSKDEAVVSKYMTHLGISYAEAHLSQLPTVIVMRELWMFGFYRPGEVVVLSLPTPQAAWATWAQAYGFWLLLPLSGFGFFAARRRGIPRWPLVIYGAFSLFIAAAMVGHWRYRMTLDLSLMVLSAIALDTWASKRSRNDRSLRPWSKDPTERPVASSTLVS